MSTKATRALLAKFKETMTDGSPEHTLYLDALEETRAIERAAKAIEAWQSAPVATNEDKQRLSKDASAAFDVLSSIAKDAP